VSVKDTDETLIDDVCSRVRELLADNGAVDAEAFVRQFYRWVSPDDLVERDALDLYGLAIGQLGLARRRRPGETKLRVYNPVFETHGWGSTHTAVEIVTDDKPFLIDSVSIELNRRGFGVHLIIHPVMYVRRDADGTLLEVLTQGADEPDAIAESVIHAEVDRQTDPARLEELRAELLRVIGEVRAAVDDWPLMRERALGLAAELAESPPAPLEPEEVEEARAFLEWLEDHNFTFLGYRDYELVTEDD
jgi:glutamate dehydrogenase